MNIFSPNCLSPAMQLDKNTQDIKTLFANQPQIYYTSEDLDASDTTTPLSTTDITDVDNIGNQPILISANGRLYKITSIVDSTVYCKYEATLPQGDGFNFTGSWVSGNEYHKNDVVTYTSNNITTAYILITNSLNGSTTPPPLDTTNWTVFTSGGLSNWHKIIKTYGTLSECFNDLSTIFQKNPSATVRIISEYTLSNVNQSALNIYPNRDTQITASKSQVSVNLNNYSPRNFRLVSLGNKLIILAISSTLWTVEIAFGTKLFSFEETYSNLSQAYEVSNFVFTGKSWTTTDDAILSKIQFEIFTFD